MPKEIKRWRKPGVSYYAYIGLFECENCGEHFECSTDQVTYGKRRWCRACTNKKMSQSVSTHNDSRTPLYHIWQTFRRLSKGHAYSDMFIEYETFKNWCISEGWQEGQKIALKCKDQGYFPGNIYFTDFADSKSQSAAQGKMPKNNTSGYIGVSFVKSSNTYRTVAVYKGDKFYMGGFKTAYDAARYRDIELEKRNWPNRRSLHSC